MMQSFPPGLHWQRQEENFYKLLYDCGGLFSSGDHLTNALRSDGYEVLSRPTTIGDGYYESGIVGSEKILIEITA